MTTKMLKSLLQISNPKKMGPLSEGLFNSQQKEAEN